MNKILAGLALFALAMAVRAEAAGEVLGVAVDRQDGQPIIFASERPWEECKGGAAYKADMATRKVNVGCWVIIADEGVFFVMWKDGELSNVPQRDVRPCTSKDECKREVVK